jgi:glycosyltransferase involved in cell wall biosynthesis
MSKDSSFSEEKDAKTRLFSHGLTGRAQNAARERKEQKFFGSFFQKRTKLLFVSHAAELGGAEQGLIDLAAHLGPCACEVLLFADGPLRGALQHKGVTVHVLPGGRGVLGLRRGTGVERVAAALPATLGLSLRLAWRARRYRLIYANSQKAAGVAMLAGLLCGRKIIWHLHDILDAAHFALVQRRAMALASRVLAHRVIVVSEAARKAYLQSGGGAGRVRVVYNGVDPRAFDTLAEKPRAALRDALGLPQGKLIGLFGRITPWKGQRVLIEALPLLPGVRAIIVGAALFGEDQEEAALRDLARRIGVADRVDFLGYRADTPLLMRAADLVVHCSTAPEPFGRVIVEAILAGTPVIAADSGASREILGDAENWLARPNDPHTLAAKISAMLTGAWDIAPLRARIYREFTLPRMAARIEAILAEMP